jgi:DNA-binding XRE family transcriptional regulator
LTLSLKIAEIFDKSIEEIFYFEPIIRDLLGNKTLDELEDISRQLGINTERLIKLKNIDNAQLSMLFSENELYKIAKALDSNFEALFIIE